MLDINWIYVVFFAAGVPAMIIMLGLAYKAKSLANLFFGLSLFSFLLGVTLTYFSQINPDLSREWGDLVAITLVLCGLFVKTRNSKPIFARFPMPMTMLPLIGIFFYPMIIEAEVVKDLLRITYQGGAILVGLLVISINHMMYKHRSVLILSCIVFLVAFTGYWFIELPNKELVQNISLILMSAGMLLGAIGFRKVSLSKINKPVTA